ncbi:hypothetical protein ACIBEJ_06920 [Nonomuraea sp. NPDC050790]
MFTVPSSWTDRPNTRRFRGPFATVASISRPGISGAGSLLR